MFGINKLKKRIKSLEDHLGVVYSNEEYPDHAEVTYGFLNRFDKRLETLEKKDK